MKNNSYLSELRGLFSSEPCNTQRQHEVDLAKAIVASCLAAIHVFVKCSTDEILDSYGIPYFFDSILGGPMAAPMFMFCMGIGLIYAKDHSPRHVFFRGVWLFCMSFVLNTVRYVIPSAIGYCITGDFDFYFDSMVIQFFSNDIWQFAGLAHMVMALFLKLGMTPFGTLIAGMVMHGVGYIFNDIDTGSDVTNLILCHLIGVGCEGRIESDFPLLLWFVIYAAGFVYGYYLQHLKDKDRFYKMVTVPLLLISVSVMIGEAFMGVGMMGGSGANVFYHMSLPEAFVCIVFVIANLGIYYRITKHMTVRAIAIVEDMSRSLMGIYFVQWCLVMWTIDLIIYPLRGDKYLDWPYELLIGVILGYLSVVVGNIVSDYVHNRHEDHIF